MKLEEKKVSVKEGDELCLPTDAKLHEDDKIQWYYEDEGEDNLIAEINKETKMKLPAIYDGADGRFRSKLTLNVQTGDLTITDIRTIHSGLYILKISSKIRTKYKRFTISVGGEFIKC